MSKGKQYYRTPTKPSPNQKLTLTPNQTLTLDRNNTSVVVTVVELSVLEPSQHLYNRP